MKDIFVYDPSLVLYLPLWKRNGNQFISDDARGHLCTVTGATWGIQGRTFVDTSGHFINLNAVLAIGTSIRTFEFWWKGTINADLVNSVYGNRNTNVNGYIIQVYETELSLINAFSVTSIYCAATTLNGIWHHIVIVRAGIASNAIYVDGVSQTLTTNTENLTDPVETLNTRIGVQVITVDARFFKGIIGEVRVYNRILGALEVANNYLASKWRYR